MKINYFILLCCFSFFAHYTESVTLTVIGSQSNILRSDDGIEWDHKTGGFQHLSTLRAVDFVDTQNGWIVGDAITNSLLATILHTFDGGDCYNTNNRSMYQLPH